MISFVIPVFNGYIPLRDNLPFLIDFLSKNFTNYEILIVDDGSDNHDDIKILAKELNCKYLNNGLNRGKGYSVRSGIRNSVGDIIFFTDADIPFNCSCILDFIKLIKDGSDFVIGDRRNQKSDYFNRISFKRKIGSKIYSWIKAKLVGLNGYDTQCGIKAFQRNSINSVINKLEIDGFAFDIELLLAAHQKNMKISSVPVILRNQDSKSISFLKHSIIMLKDLLIIRKNWKQKKYE